MADHEPMPGCPMCGAPIPKGFLRFCSTVCRVAFGRGVARGQAAARRAAGLCRYCGSKADDGKLTCAECRGKYRRRMDVHLEDRRRRGACIRCGRRRRPGYRQCWLCVAYSAEWRRRNAR